MYHTYLFHHVSPPESQEQHLRRGFELLISSVAKRSSRFICYGWENSSVPHQDATSEEITFLAPFISWRHAAPEWSEHGFVAGGDVTPAMIEAFIKAPPAQQWSPSPVFALKLEAEDGEPLLDYGDYGADITLRLTEDEADALQKSLKDAEVLVAIDQI